MVDGEMHRRLFRKHFALDQDQAAHGIHAMTSQYEDTPGSDLRPHDNRRSNRASNDGAPSALRIIPFLGQRRDQN